MQLGVAPTGTMPLVTSLMYNDGALVENDIVVVPSFLTVRENADPPQVVLPWLAQKLSIDIIDVFCPLFWVELPTNPIT